MKPADPSKHRQRHKRQARDHRYRTADRSGDNQRDHNEQQIQPEQSGHETFSDEFGEPTLQIINTADEVSLESILATESAKIVHNIDTVFRTACLDHPECENRVRTVFTDKTFGHARILRLLHDLHHLFVADEKRKRRAIAFGQKRWQRNYSANIFLVLQRAMQSPHSLVGLIRVQSAAARRGDDQCQRVGAAGPIYEFQSVAKFPIRLEISHKARVSVHPRQTKSQTYCQQNDG